MTFSGSSSSETRPADEIVYPFAGPGYDPDRGVIGAEPDDEVLIVINFAVFEPSEREPVDTHMLRAFASLGRGEHPGYIGGSIILGVDEAWTMSAWRDEASIVRFYGSAAHREAMAAALASVLETRPARMTIPAREVPLSWDHAKDLCLKLTPDPRVSRRGLHRDQPGG